MGDAEQLDEVFLRRALEHRALSPGQASTLRYELKRRRQVEPDVGAHDLAVERGFVDVQTALYLLNAQPGETATQLKARTRPLMRPRGADSDPTRPANLEPEGAPTIYDPPPANAARLGPRNPNEESQLEMELPPPGSQSGDSLFEEGSNHGVAALPVTPEPMLDAPTDSPVVVERTPSTWGDLGSTNLGMEAPSIDQSPEGFDEAAPTLIEGARQEIVEEDDDQPLGGFAEENFREASRGEDEIAAVAPAPTSGRFAQMEEQSFEAPTFDDEELVPDDTSPKMGTIPPPTIVEQPAQSSALNESAVRDVMRDADDGYFGKPADLTRPGISDDVLAVDKVEEITLFDSEKEVDHSPQAELTNATVNDFAKTHAPATRPKPPITEVKDDSDFDVGVTLAGDTVEAGRASTIYEDSDADVDADDITGGITNEPSTGGRTTGSQQTALATGEVGRNKKPNIGVESNITDDKNLEGEQISASQMTLAEVRGKMGIGQGVKISQDDTASKVVKRLKQGGGAYKRYTVIREIARGGMGKVLEVEDNDLRRSVALKVLRKEMLNRKDLVERFLEEAQITGQLEHPNIVPVHEIGVDGRGNLYFTMKLVEGEELSNVLKRLKQGDASAARAYPLSRLVEIFIKLCEGLAFAHSRGVIHRDLKPANIMVGRFGEVQIMDWGVAKIVGTREETAERTVASDRKDAGAGTTMVGAILGTPSYMSPEQARGETDSLDVQSDIFSLGVILYELLCYKLPWTGKNSEEILEMVREANPESPSKRAPEKNIPPDLEQLVMRCLEKDPRKRLGSTQELIDNLRSYQEGRTLSAVEYTVGQLIRKWLARNKRGVIIGSIMLLLLVGGIVGTVVALRQARMAQVPGKLKDADELLALAQAARQKMNLEEANKQASNAKSVYESVLAIDDNNEAARTGRISAETEQALVQASYTRMAEEKAQREKEAERKQKLADALTHAQSSRNSADKMASDYGLDGKPQDETLKQQYTQALQDYIAVLAIDATNEEAGKEKLRIEKWLSDYDAGRERARQAKELLDKLIDLRNRARAAMALLANLEKYEEAKNSVLDVIRVADLALAVPLSDESSGKLKDEAATFKSQVTLEYARQSLSQAPPKFEVCDLMLSIAEITGKLAKEVKAQRAELENKRGQYSKFQQLLKDADDAIKAQTWTLAVQRTSEAIAEAEKSKYATAQDKERLSKMSQFAQLEEVHARESSATTSDQFAAILADYLRLLRDTIKDQDYVQRADGYVLGVKSKLGVALLSEARDAKDEAVVADLLVQALEYLTEKAHRAEAQGRLDEITAKKALAGLSSELKILPRGEFIVGSLRESDYNTQRTIEQNKILFFDRTPVTNGDYLEFVQAGGYKKPEYWDKEAIEHLPLFVDSTGQTGPKDWVKGGFDASLKSVPVTGVCWFEARAYARYKGKRLPTAEEWEIAAGAPKTDAATNAGDYPFGTRENAPAIGVPRLREVGTAEWDKNIHGIRDLGHNCAEWTDSAGSEGRVIVKGAQTGLRPDLFLRYARRAKNSSAKMTERNSGRGFRCVQEYKPKKDG